MSESLGLLRGIGENEVALMLEWRNSPEVRANMYTRHVITMQEHIGWWERTKESKAHRYFMYELAGKPLGVVGFVGIDLVNQNSSWAFYASPDAPKGTGSKMEYLALEYAFEELDLNKLYCEVLDFNASVVKLHKKFGFSIEGILRSQHKVDSEFVDIYRLGILRKEWADLRDAMLEKLIRI